MLFTVLSQSIMHMHVPYNTACFVLYTMHAAVEAAAAAVWLALIFELIQLDSVLLYIAIVYILILA